MSYERYDENGRILCVFNAGSGSAEIPLPRGYSECSIELTTSDACKIRDDGCVELPEFSCVVIKAKSKTREKLQTVGNL